MLLALIGSSALTVEAAAQAPYTVTQLEDSRPLPPVARTKYAVQTGSSPIDKFDLIHVRKTPGGAPVILLSPFGFPAEFFEVSTSGYADSFAARLALEGYDLYLVDSRMADLEPGSCESGAVDCSPMAGWDQARAIADAMIVREIVEQKHPSKVPVIGGFSGGSSTALATIDQYPGEFSGLMLWEGTLYTDDPAIQARNANFCANDEAALANGVYYDAAVQGFRTLFGLAAAAPSAPSPIPVFPPGTTNLQALLFALTLPDASNPLNFTDGFIRLIGDPFAGTLAYSDVNRLLTLAPLVGTYAPVAFIRDSHCAMGGLDSTYTSNLDAFTGKVLVFAEGYGFGQMMIDTAAQLSSADVTVDYRPELGEMDLYFNNDWVNIGVNPLVAWLNTVDFIP